MTDEISQLEIAAKRIYLETFELVLQTSFPCAEFHDPLVERVKLIAKECSIELGDCFATAWLCHPAYWFAIENVVVYVGGGNWDYRQPMTDERKVELRNCYAACYESKYREYVLANLKNARSPKQENQENAV